MHTTTRIIPRSELVSRVNALRVPIAPPTAIEPSTLRAFSDHASATRAIIAHGRALALLASPAARDCGYLTPALRAGIVASVAAVGIALATMGGAL